MFVVALLLDCDCASVDDTVVLETCREPDDLRPFDEPISVNTVELKFLLLFSFLIIIIAHSPDKLLYSCDIEMTRHSPELGEFWLPRDDVRGGCGPVGGLPPFRGLPGGRVSVFEKLKKKHGN